MIENKKDYDRVSEVLQSLFASRYLVNNSKLLCAKQCR